MSALAPTTPGGLDSPLLRDSRHRAARAARELEDWLDYLRVANKAARTIDSYERTAAALLRAFPHKTLAEFTDGDLLQVLAEFQPKTRHQNRTHLNSLFKWAYLTRRIQSNPVDFVPAIRYKASRAHDVFTDAEVDALCGLPSPDGQLMTVLLWTGLRRAEARSLTVKRMDFDRRRVIVIEGAKGGKDRWVPMLPRVAAAVDELVTQEGLERADFLWYDKSGGNQYSVRKVHRLVSNHAFQNWWERCLDAAGVRYRNPHMSRHSYATNLRREGIPLDEIQRWLGHESISTTRDIYVHADAEDAAARLMEAFA